MKNKHSIFTLFLLLMLVATSLLHAKNYRMDMKTPAVQLYESMLLFAEMRKYVQIEKSLPYLKEIFSSEKEKFKVDLQKEIEEAIKSGDQAVVLSAVRKTIYYDIKDIFHSVNSQFDKEPGSTIISWLKMAGLDYKMLSPYIKRNSIETSKQIDADFALLMSNVSSEKSNVEEIKKVMDNIENNMMSAGKFR